MATLASLDIAIGANTANLKKGLDDALGKTKKFAKDAKGNANSVSQSFMGIGTSISSATKLIGASAVAGLAVAMKAQINYMDTLGETAQKLGTTADKLSEFQYVAKMSGVENSTLEGTLNKLNKELVNNEEAFIKLGIATRDSNGAFLDGTTVLQNAAAIFAEMPDGPEKAALAMELFGKSGAEIIPLLNQGADGIARLKAEANTLGLVITPEQAEMAGRANDAIDRFNSTLSGFALNLAGIVLPAATTFLEVLDDMIERFTIGDERAAQFFGTVGKQSEVMARFESAQQAAAAGGTNMAGLQEALNVLDQSQVAGLMDDLKYRLDNLLTTANQVTSLIAGDIMAVSESYPILGEALQNMSAEVDRLTIAVDQAINEGDYEAAKQYSDQLEIAIDNLSQAIAGAEQLSGIDMSGSVSAVGTLANAFGTLATTISTAITQAKILAAIPVREAAKKFTSDISSPGVASTPLPFMPTGGPGTFTPGALPAATSQAEIEIADALKDLAFDSAGSGGGSGGGGGGGSPDKETDEAIKETANNTTDSFLNFLKSSFSKALATGDFKEFAAGILDNITMKIIDSFSSGLMDALFGSIDFDGIFKNFGETISNGLSSALSGIGGGGGLFGGIFKFLGGLFGFAEGGLVPSDTPYSKIGRDSVPALLTPGELVVPADEVSNFLSGKGPGKGTNAYINITGDISRQTQKEIFKMLPEIARGVNSYNKEVGNI